MRSKFMSALLIVLSVTILVGVVLTALFLLRSEEDENFLNFDLENGKSQTVEFQDLNMYPGKTVSYTMFLFCDIRDEYDLAFSFVDKEGEILKDYIDVTVTLNGEVFWQDKLAEMFTEDAKLTVAELQQGVPCTVRIDFSMDQDVGNEPMGQKTLFDLIITASNE